MTKSNLILPKRGKDYELLENGVIRVARLKNTPSVLRDEDKTVPSYLSLVDHSLSIESKKKYKRDLDKQEERFNKYLRRLASKKLALIVVLQGRDGAGKSGGAKQILQASDFDPKLFQWIPIGPPTEDEKAHPYLWRFFAFDRMPRYGQIRVFDRSWAERLLVEPVMGIIDKPTLKRSYPELRTFEWMLVKQGAVLVKIWMDISKDEQKKRFEERKRDKPWKYSESDAVAREHWNDYTRAANAMFHLTGTEWAPWNIISSESKHYSRLTLLQLLNDSMKSRMESSI